ncbi:thioredoxin [Thiotrichales bacterium 19S11-10]|nr:thioredoxin [Thiotrichales bacterium 19S11-10]MCF6808053.1 thioredoxin [Thiotrichales bacterium 19S9-11]MCF6812068.1 thioredoxin [Thiotrichales bacterium 19S9-12]
MSTVDVTDQTFEKEVIQSDIPVIVDYWAEWCGPCKMISPVFKEISENYSDKIKFVKVNVDDNPESPTRYGVRGIPTLMIIKDGVVEATKVGAMSKQQLIAFIESNL